MNKKLILTDGTRERELHLVGRIVVGRDPSCEISRDDSLLSRRHAEFVTSGNTVTVKDLGSRNGVFVNGARASEHTLEPGDVVQIGPLRARFVVDTTPRSMTPETMDADRTAVIRKASPAAAAVPLPIHPAVALAFEEVDEDATRLVPAPRAEVQVAPASEVPLGRAVLPEPEAEDEDEDEDATRFTAAPAIQTLRPVPRPIDPPARIAAAAPSAAKRAAVSPSPGGSALSGFIYGQLTALSLIIVGAAGVAVLLWMPTLGVQGDGSGVSLSLAWFVLPVVAAIVGTYVIGATVNRRISQVLDAERRRT